MFISFSVSMPSATTTLPRLAPRLATASTIARASRSRLAVADEGLVDLDLVERELVQVIERRVAGAEIVERQADAELLEMLDRHAGLFRFLQQQALGDFELEPLRAQAGFCQRGSDMQHQARILELHR